MPYQPLTQDQANELFRDWFDAAWANYHELSGVEARQAYGEIIDKVCYKDTHWGLTLTPEQHAALYN